MHHPTDKIAHTTAFVTPVVKHWLEREIAQWVHPMKDRSDDPSHHERTLLPRSYISLPMVGHLLMVQCVFSSIPHGGPIELFIFQPVLYNWYNKGYGMWCLLCGMLHIKYILLQIKKSSPCGGSFPVLLYVWPFTIMPQPHIVIK